eukprot:3894128-Amphidinium_carterae.1
MSTASESSKSFYPPRPPGSGYCSRHALDDKVLRQDARLRARAIWKQLCNLFGPSLLKATSASSME